MSSINKYLLICVSGACRNVDLPFDLVKSQLFSMHNLKLLYRLTRNPLPLQDYDNDGKLSFEDFEKAVKEDRLLLEVFGPCLPEAKVQRQQPNRVRENFQRLKKKTKTTCQTFSPVGCEPTAEVQATLKVLAPFQHLGPKAVVTV